MSWSSLTGRKPTPPRPTVLLVLRLGLPETLSTTPTSSPRSRLTSLVFLRVGEVAPVPVSLTVQVIRMGTPTLRPSTVITDIGTEGVRSTTRSPVERMMVRLPTLLPVTGSLTARSVLL